MSDETKAAVAEMGNRVVNAWLIWKLALLRLAIYCFVTDVGFYTAAMHSTKWSDISIEDHVILFLEAMALDGTIVMAFLDKTISNLEKGKLLPPDQAVGDTQVFSQQTTQTQIESVKTTVTEPKV